MTTDSLSQAQIKTVLDTMQAIGGTIVNIKRYPPGSAIIKMALDRGVEHFENFFESVDSFTISESEKQILLNEERLAERLAMLPFVQRFLSTIIDRNIRSLTFSKGLGRSELERFIELLGHPPDELKQMGNLSELLAERNVTHIKVDAKVFVAIRKDQIVAEISAMERLTEDGGLSPEQFEDSTFVSYFLSKLQHSETNLSPEKVKELKEAINFDSLRDSKNIDYENLAPVIAGFLEKWQDDVQEIEHAETDDLVPESSQVAADIAPSISPELAETIHQHTVTIRRDAADAARDERVGKLTKTFEGISQAIFKFKQPAVRNKLLNDFLKIITNFKTQTLGQVLSATLARDNRQDSDLKQHILMTLSLKKKSALIDLFLNRYQRWIEGLAPTDFGIDAGQIDNAGQMLQRLVDVIRKQKQSPELEEKASRALAMLNKLKQEAPEPEKLLILKVRRLLTKDPKFLVEDSVQAYLPDLIIRLIDIKRPDVAKKVLEKLAQNVQNEDSEIRLRVAGALVRVSQTLLNAENYVLHPTIYGQLLRAFRREAEPRVYAAYLASLVSDLGRLVEEGNFTLAVHVFNGMTTLRQNETDPNKQKFLAMAERKIAEHQELIDHLVEKFKDADDKQSEMALQVLSNIDERRSARLMFDLLRESEEMRLRKKVMSVLTRMPQVAAPAVRDLLEQPGQPWFFVRNLILLAAEFKDADGHIEKAVERHLTDKNEQVHKACLSTLVKIATPAADEILAGVLPKLDDGSQRMIINHLGHTRSKAGVDFMLGLLATRVIERDESLATDVIHALGRIGDDRAGTVLLKVLKPGGLAGLFKSRPSDRITATILRALSDLKAENALSLIRKFAHDSNPDIARAAQAAIRKMEEGD